MIFVIFKTGGPAVIEPIFMRDSGFPDHIFVRRQAPIIYIIICSERAGLPDLVGTTCSVPARCFTAVILLFLFYYHLHKMFHHLISQLLVNLHLLTLESHQHLAYLIGIACFARSEITSILIHLEEIIVCSTRLLPQALQLNHLPHLI